MNKIQETNLQKYGYKTPLLIPENREKAIRLIKSEEILNKRKNTNLQKYGNISPLGNSEVRRKIVNSYYKNGSVKTSKQQYSLYEMLKTEFENCYLNYPFDRYSLDCYVCIDDIKINIEYDGNFWHKEKERDLKRDDFLINNNIKVLRIKANHKVPTLEQLKEKLQILIETDCYYSELILEN